MNKRGTSPAGGRKRGKPLFSLKWELMGIVVACWLLPVLLVIGALSYYVNVGLRRQLNETIRTSVSHAAYIGRRSVETAVAASRKASYDNAVHSAYRSFEKTGNRQRLYEQVDAYLVREYRYDDKFKATMLCFLQEPDTIYSTYNHTVTAYTDVLSYKYNAHAEVLRISKTLDTGIAFYTHEGETYMVRNMVSSGDSFRPYAVLVMQLNTAAVFSSFENIVWHTGVTLYLNGTPVVLASMPEGGALDAAQIGVVPQVGAPLFIDSGNTTLVFGGEQTDRVRLTYLVGVDRIALLEQLSGFVGNFYWLVALLVPLLALAVWFFSRNIFRPIHNLNHAARAIEGGELGYRVEHLPRNREFAYLTDAFNGMSARLREQFERIYSEELALRDARIMALQSQINPHFLNNTLEIINWEARLEGNNKVSSMIEALGTMLDAAMDRKSSPLVPLHQELLYVDAYLYIISERFGKRLAVEKQVDPALLQQKVPRLILQPIIENAVEHGVAPRQHGRILIRVFAQQGRLLLEIENDHPMSPENERMVHRLLSPGYDPKGDGSLHLGIHNVHLRLRMIYGEASGLCISNRGSATVATIDLPLQEE